MSQTLFSLADALERYVTHEAAESERLGGEVRRSLNEAGLARARDTLARFVAGDAALDALGLYTQLERCTPLLLFHVIRRRSAMNLHRSGLQQSYGDHNRLLVLGIDRLARGDVAWYRGRCWQPQGVTDSDIERCCAAHARTALGRGEQTALWLAACLHDYGKLVMRDHGLDAEDAVALAGPLLDRVCEPSLRPLVEIGIRYHDLIEYVGTGETPAALIAGEIETLAAAQRPVALALLGAIQLAGAASLGEGRVTARKVEIYLDCTSGALLDDRSIESRLARLLAGDMRVVPTAARAQAAARLAELAPTARAGLGELLERVVLREWSRLCRTLAAREGEQASVDLLFAGLLAVERCWQARSRDPLHIVFSNGSADWLIDAVRGTGTNPRALDHKLASQTGLVTLLNGAQAMICGPDRQEAIHETVPAFGLPERGERGDPRERRG